MSISRRVAAILVVLFFCVTPVQQANAYSIQAGSIVDSLGNVIELHGVNWFGFETDSHAPHGLWARNMEEMIDQMQDIGVNAVRLPFCPDTLQAVETSSIHSGLNPDIDPLNSLELLDRVVQELDDREMYILLDHHRPDCEEISELWYTDSYSEDEWLEDLTFMAERYGELEYVLGIDIKNEPHGAATWGSGNESTDWNTAAEKAADIILSVAPHLLIFVEGIQYNDSCSDGSGHWWGGNLEPIECYPLDIPASQLVLSPHVYGPDVYEQSYFSDGAFPDNMPAIWDQHFGFAADDGYVLAIGEFGGKYGHGGLDSDVVWQDVFIEYAIDRGIVNSFYWSWNPNSSDTGGLLQDDWATLHDDKVELLQSLWESRSDADNRIAITGQKIQTFDAATDEVIDSVRAFKKKQHKITYHAHTVYKKDDLTHIFVLARAKKTHKKKHKLRMITIDEAGNIESGAVHEVRLKRGVKYFRNLELSTNVKYGKKARILIKRKGKTIKKQKYRVTKKKKLLKKAS